MKMRLKVGWVQLQAKRHLRPPEAGRSKKDALLEPSEDSDPGGTLIFGLLIPRAVS